MKRFLLLICFALAVSSCSNDVEFNEHTLQVVKDSEFWKAQEFSATMNDDGFVSIVGLFEKQTLTLYLESPQPGTYQLGAGSNSTAWYIDADGKGFTTEYRGDGQVTIDSYDPVGQTFTGEFNFNAFSLEDQVINFSMGIFYQVPITDKPDVEDLN